jgi:DNA polymerase-3 subunit delta
MPIITYNHVADHLSQATAEHWPPVTLIFGEELLCKKALDAVMDLLMPDADRTVGVESFDGGEAVIGTVLSSLNTYALLSSAKVVVFHNARLFYSANARQGLREKMNQAGESGEMKKAARPLLNLMALDGLDFEDLNTATHRKRILGEVGGQPPEWFDQLLAYCRDKELKVPAKQDDADLLKAAMEKGFPDGHRLLIATDVVDRRKTLFKAIGEKGLVVDCSVPKGETRNDRLARDAVMQAAMDEVLAKAGKQMALNARKRVMQWTGFDLRTLAANLEKLVSFVGDRQRIEDNDVKALLQPTRKDPIFEFTNAVADRNLTAALLLMQGMLTDGMHPLQLLSAVANQLRRLLLAKDFIVRDRGRNWSAGVSFPRFKTGAFKVVLAEDEKFASLQQEWEAMLDPDAKKPKGKKTGAGDLALARNPRSPFPVYQTLKKADAFSLEALAAAMRSLSETDLRMKSTGQDPRMLLETFLVKLCKQS